MYKGKTQKTIGMIWKVVVILVALGMVVFTIAPMLR